MVFCNILHHTVLYVIMSQVWQATFKTSLTRGCCNPNGRHGCPDKNQTAYLCDLVVRYFKKQQDSPTAFNTLKPMFLCGGGSCMGGEWAGRWRCGLVCDVSLRQARYAPGAPTTNTHSGSNHLVPSISLIPSSRTRPRWRISFSKKLPGWIVGLQVNIWNLLNILGHVARSNISCDLT